MKNVPNKYEELLRRACILSRPYFNGKSSLPPSQTQASGIIQRILWDHGYVPASQELIGEGVSEKEISAALTYAKEICDVVDSQDVHKLSDDLKATLNDRFIKELLIEPDDDAELLLEHLVRGIGDFEAIIYSNEGRHPGRPHVKVVLQDGPVKISLDDPPEVLGATQRKRRGLSSALAAVADNRERLLDVWRTTRPDDQKLPKDKAEQNAHLKDGRSDP